MSNNRSEIKASLIIKPLKIFAMSAAIYLPTLILSWLACPCDCTIEREQISPRIQPSTNIESQPTIPNIGTAVWLDAYPEAKCLDGSPALYYIRKATSTVNNTKWVMHIQGGGWCDDMKSCYSRSQSRLGSSLKKYNNNETMDWNNIEGCDNNRWCGALMVNDRTVNPYSYDWNAVLFMYCDGASWTGNVADPVPVPGAGDSKLYFRGWKNMEAVMSDLIANHDLGSAAEVLIGGDSAGGLATFMHIDYMHERILASGARAKVIGMPDSGYWPDQEGFATTFRNMYAMQNGTDGLASECVRRNADDLTKCLFPQYFADHINTTLFPLQSIFDPLQKGSHPQEHGMWLLADINRTVLSRPSNGAWIHSCERHCGAELLTIDGVHVRNVGDLSGFPISTAQIFIL